MVTKADKPIKFVFHGRPKVQKNDLVIRYKFVGKRRIPFIGHSKKMSDIRDQMTIEFHRQYKAQGYCDPIDYLFEAEFVFYVPKQSEPDLDNLPAIVLDSLQGMKIKKTKTKVAITLTDDKLLRYESSRKVVKGDPEYDDNPRTEVTIRRHQVRSGDRSTASATASGRKNSTKGPARKV